MSAGHIAKRAVGLGLALALAGCNTVDLQEGGTLSSYKNLGAQGGFLEKRRTFADKDFLSRAKTVRIQPSVFKAAAAARVTSDGDRKLVANALDRALCVALSERYEVVGTETPADITVRNVVVDILPTDKVFAGVSTAVSFGVSFVSPVSAPRLPLGLGGVALEGEALDDKGAQRAAILWARGANSFTESPRVSQVGDAYSLATAYGDDFAKLVATGEAPSLLAFKAPSMDRVVSYFGGKPKYPACERFGREPGVPGMVASAVGAPPEWTDSAGPAKP